MIEIIIFVISLDSFEGWQDFLPNIITKIKSSNDFQEIYGALLALFALFKKYKTTFVETEKLEALVEETFGFLETFAQTLLSDYGLQAASAAHVILKIFSTAISVFNFISIH